MPGAFTHRTLTGWIGEYVCRPLPGPWPQIPLDDEALEDSLRALGELQKHTAEIQKILDGNQ